MAKSPPAPKRATQTITPADVGDMPAEIINDEAQASDVAAQPAEEQVIDLVDTGAGKAPDELTVNEAASPAGITGPIVTPVQDAADLDPAKLDRDELRKLDGTDSARAAAIRRQQDWAEDAKHIFKGPHADQLAQEAHLKALDEMDAVNRAAQKKADVDRDAALNKADRAQQLADHKAEYENLKQRALNIRSEIERLEKEEA
jgi:hypothetical protein